MKNDEERRPCLCGLLDEGQTCFCEYDDEDWTLLRKRELSWYSEMLAKHQEKDQEYYELIASLSKPPKTTRGILNLVKALSQND